jgi:alpha-N-acetylglucosamine transferase
MRNPHVTQKRLQNVFTKLSVWKLVQFKRIVLLDADITVLDNIDELCRCDAR